jgi:beta-alanine degradation protein BauB
MAKAPLPSKTDPDKYRLVLENDKVRVYIYTDKPGDKTKLHYHDAFVLYALAPFKRKLIFESGESVVREFKGGETIWSEAQNHIGENVGATETKVLIVELK